MNREMGLEDAYTHLAPMVDTDLYMQWLLREVRREGCRIVEQKISGPLSAAPKLARAVRGRHDRELHRTRVEKPDRRADASPSRGTHPRQERRKGDAAGDGGALHLAR